ncbi:MAG: toll/interleukin-1 receptor domain-containing protein [Nitrosomonas oligotropha]|uniref:Toll/interleukin-1 receptor domain-containing protein n=1 Tax=Nitrosomonas oligotropha TaxID=42354 RepID=A0A5C7VRP2_9PROT|nr:MAG: toll/interleukin-1 receptor domain-containing protein [Nitrosomonas oligotropha]
MKVFISWSGNRSRAVAELLNDWVKCVLQATRPWLSTRDIDRGALWFSEIHDQLKDTSVGIVCLTQENKNRPWILFEAGALAKGLSSNRVCTFLIDLKPTDLEDPLAQFNHTLCERGSMRELIRTLNNCLTTNALDERILDQVFDTYWSQFETKFDSALEMNPPSEKAEPRPKDDILAEILENTRFLHARLRRLESRPDKNVIEDERLRMSEREFNPERAELLFRHLREIDMPLEDIIENMSMNGIPTDYAIHLIDREAARDKRKDLKKKL